MPACSPVGASAAALALVAVLAAGCSASGSESDDPAAWAGRVCSALVPLAQANGSPPAVNAKDFAATKVAVSSSLATAADAVPKALTGLDGAGASPVAGGDAVVAKLRGLVTPLKATMLDAKIKIDAANPADAGTFIGALADALTARATLATKVDEAKRAVEANPDVTAAARKAPSCTQAGLVSQPTVGPGSASPSAAPSTPPSR